MSNFGDFYGFPIKEQALLCFIPQKGAALRTAPCVCMNLVASIQKKLSFCLPAPFESRNPPAATLVIAYHLVCYL